MPSNERLTYPAPPWKLRGQGLVLIQFNHSLMASKYLPASLSIQSILPGRTAAGYYIAQYETPLLEDEGSPWHEWGEILGYAKINNRKGFYIREMAVDSDAALHGGRELWGLNKTKAALQFSPGNNAGCASVSIENEALKIEWNEYLFWFPSKKNLRFITQVEKQACVYQVNMKGMFRLARIHVLQTMPHRMNAVSSGWHWGLRFRDTEVTAHKPTAL